MIGRRPTVVVAFDGLVAETLSLRAQAVADAIDHVGVGTKTHDVRELIAGRSIAEAVRLACGTDADETIIDLATLHARRICAGAMSGPVTLAPGAAEWIQRASARVRVVVRSDSLRQDAERVLDSAGLAMFVSMMWCSDDTFWQPSSPPTFVQAYDTIVDRSAATAGIVGRIHGLECASEELCSRVSTARIHRVMSVTEAALDALELF